MTFHSISIINDDWFIFYLFHYYYLFFLFKCFSAIDYLNPLPFVCNITMFSLKQALILVQITSTWHLWCTFFSFIGTSWVGGIRAFHGDFVWYHNNDDLVFTNYDRGEPNNDSGDENCLEIRSDNHGTWNDVDCGFFLSFICEKD